MFSLLFRFLSISYFFSFIHLFSLFIYFSFLFTSSSFAMISFSILFSFFIKFTFFQLQSYYTPHEIPCELRILGILPGWPPLLLALLLVGFPRERLLFSLFNHILLYNASCNTLRSNKFMLNLES